MNKLRMLTIDNIDVVEKDIFVECLPSAYLVIDVCYRPNENKDRNTICLTQDETKELYLFLKEMFENEVDN